MALRPDLYCRAVTDIDVDDLVRRGITALLIDLDNTLVPRNTIDAAPDVRAWMTLVRERGLKICIVSNNWHERVMDAEDSLGVPVVGKSTKPLPGGFRRGLRLLGATSSKAAVIGDQIFTDVLGGNLVGATTILVTPLVGGSDLPHTKVLRALERLVLAGRDPLCRAMVTASVTDDAGEPIT
jgi:HAD superfamily phosphatase (TIGR01668 family)